MTTTSQRDWLGDLRHQLLESTGEADAERLLTRYAKAFPGAFVDSHTAAAATAWIAALEEYASRSSPLMHLLGSRAPTAVEGPDGLRLALLWASPAPALLADVFPVLENLGLRISGHAGYDVRPAGRQPVLIEEFRLLSRDAALLADERIRDLVTDTFEAVWSGRAEDDGFNQLVIRAGLPWRDVMILRAGFAYLRQTATAFGQAYAERTLLKHSTVTHLLVELFHARFDPAHAGTGEEQQVRARVESALDQIDNLSEDRLLRALLEFVTGTVRTNYFRHDASGAIKPYLVFKLEPHRLSFVPLPRPEVETLVYSPRVEGLHLRAARVARGGVRWSDRTEDYRTEVLGLLNAQRVKNAVIVPSGAKGAFVVKRPPTPADAGALLEEMRYCYSTFIRGLLDVTDNHLDGQLVAPPGVVCHDVPDPYLVVAADKGTAGLSDLANSIAAEYDFWLGDAFGSGGSTGYDHKALGVTARGAWESVRRHLGELGIDPARDLTTVIGIGDMSGDVFGNAMLLSDRIRLVAAFDHRNIFLDPDPDPASSYAERARLFSLPGSSWADYQPGLISAGGGVFSRTAKSIPLSPQARELLGTTADRLPADELIRAVLRAPADLLFNGGVGTYVKASTESHAEAGDRANDAVRVDATELRTRVVAEGGNLGLTQRARIEYALAGGRVNTDFIDNSAGVDTSDREVNIKILLDAAVRSGRLAIHRRDLLLEEVSEQVVEQVLANNAAQAQAISVSEALGVLWLDVHAQVIRYQELRGYLDRARLFLPDEETIAQRRSAGLGLTRPEVAVLLAASKNTVTQLLLASQVPDDPYAGTELLARYLPPRLRDEFNDLMPGHPLHREIAASVLVNEVFNKLGSGSLLRVLQLTGQPEEQANLAYLASRDVLGLPSVWAEIDRLDLAIHAHLQTSMLIEIRAVVESAARWFLRHRQAVDPAGEVARLRPGAETLTGCLHELLPATARAEFDQRVGRLVDAGSPVQLAHNVSLLRPLSTALDMIEAAHATEADLTWLAAVYFALGERLDLDWLRTRLADQGIDSHWVILAKAAVRDELSNQQRRLALAILQDLGADQGPALAIESWLRQNARPFCLYEDTLDELHGAPAVDLAMASVAVEGLRTLLFAAQPAGEGG